MPDKLCRRQFIKCGAAFSAGVLGLSRQVQASAQAGGNRHWAAIAYSPSKRRTTWSWGLKTKQEAEDSALAANANNDAKVAISGSGLWLAISTTNGGGWGAASGETLYKAVDSAEEYCKKYNGMEGTIRGSVFGGDNGVDFKIELDAEFPAGRLLPKQVENTCL